MLNRAFCPAGIRLFCIYIYPIIWLIMGLNFIFHRFSKKLKMHPENSEM